MNLAVAAQLPPEEKKPRLRVLRTTDPKLWLESRSDLVKECPLGCTMTTENCVRLQQQTVKVKGRKRPAGTFCASGKCAVGAAVTASMPEGYEPSKPKPRDLKAQRRARKRYYDEHAVFPEEPPPRPKKPQIPRCNQCWKPLHGKDGGCP